LKLSENLKKILFDKSEINTYTEINDFGSAAKILFENQKKDWELLRNGHKTLESAQFKSFQFPGYKIKVQFNPGRIISSSAKVDAKSIKERKCFLCLENLPDEQRGILYRNEYLILCNPFPILPEHFTIPKITHTPQRIKKNFNDLLELSKDFANYYTVLYNGPKCGASAPDHFHFQAGTKFFMPIDDEFQQIKNEYGEVMSVSEETTVAGIDDGLRKFISIESKNPQAIISFFNIIYEKISTSEEEPMMNILSFFEEEFGWRVLIFFRQKHRSSHYFEEGEKNILLSAAAVDLGGVCILPLEKDFNKITKENLTNIFNEIIIPKDKFEALKASVKNKL